MRAVFSSSDPIETLHKFNTGQYSIITLLDMLELLDVKETLEEDERKRAELNANNPMGSRR